VCWFSPDDGTTAISLSLLNLACAHVHSSPSTSPPLLLVWVGSRLLTCRLIAVPYFHPSTSEITPGFGSLKFCSGLGRVWGFYRDPQLGDHCGKLLVLNLCVCNLHYATLWSSLFQVTKEILILILIGQVTSWNSILYCYCSEILNGCVIDLCFLPKKSN
jgi:hypothetical protein